MSSESAPGSLSSLTVPARGTSEISVDVPADGARVSWEFSTASHDIGFSATYLRPGQPDVTAWPKGRRASQTRPNIGWFVAPSAGTIVLHFDNSFSRFRSKQVRVTTRADPGTRACLVPGMRATFPAEAAKPAATTSSASPSPAPVSGNTVGVLVPSNDAPEGWHHVVCDDCSVLLVPLSALRPDVCSFREQGNGRLVAGGFLFFRGRFVDAEAYYENGAWDCPYVGFARAVIAWARAIVAFEPEAITRANAALEDAKANVGCYWKDDGTLASIGRVIAWRDAPPVDAEDLEFAIITAEAHLLQALLMVVQESIVLIIKAGLTIRYGWKLLHRLLVSAEGMDNIHPHTQGGLDFGTAVFNLIVSVFPPALVRIVSALGFPSSRVDAVARLRRCFSTSGIRSPLAGFGLIAHHIFIPSFSCVDLRRHVSLANNTLTGLQTRFPGSYLFDIVAGRMCRAGKQMRGALEAYERVVAAQPDWEEIVHFCNYELGCVHGMLGNWDAARTCFEHLRDNNSWAPVFCAYLVAACLAEAGGDHEDVLRAMRSVQDMRLRKLGGAHPIPAEEVAAYRAEHMQQDPSPVVFPGLEMLFLFGCFQQAEPDLLEAARQRVEATSPAHPVARALCTLLRGALLAAELRWDEAERDLTAVIDAVSSDRQAFIAVRFLHLLPFALYERAQVRMRRCLPTAAARVDTADVDASKLTPSQAVAAIHELAPGIAPELVKEHLTAATADLTRARQVAESYAFKLRIHVRVHLAMREIAEMEALASGQTLEEYTAVGGDSPGAEEEDDAHLLTPTLSTIMNRVSVAGTVMGSRSRDSTPTDTSV